MLVNGVLRTLVRFLSVKISEIFSPLNEHFHHRLSRLKEVSCTFAVLSELKKSGEFVVLISNQFRFAVLAVVSRLQGAKRCLAVMKAKTFISLQTIVKTYTYPKQHFSTHAFWKLFLQSRCS